MAKITKYLKPIKEDKKNQEKEIREEVIDNLHIKNGEVVKDDYNKLLDTLEHDVHEYSFYEIKDDDAYKYIVELLEKMRDPECKQPEALMKEYANYCFSKGCSVLTMLNTLYKTRKMCEQMKKNFNMLITKFIIKPYKEGLNELLVDQEVAAASGFNPQAFMQQQPQYQLPMNIEQPVTKEQLQKRVDNLKTLIEFIPGRNLNNTQITNFENLLRLPNILQLGKIKELTLVDSTGMYDYKFQSIMYPSCVFVFNSQNGNLDWITQQIQLAN